jgi:periplasmic protein CpxP/Spy
MTTDILRRTVSALAISLAVGGMTVAPAAYAQTQYSAPQDQYHGPQARDSHRDRRGDENRPDGRIAFLHQRLGITPAQETAWSQFANEMRHAAETRIRAPEGREHADQMNAVDRLEQRARMLEMRGAETERMARALRPLYASLSDDQKRIANEVLFRGQNQRPGYAAGRGGFRGPGQRPGFDGRQHEG